MFKNKFIMIAVTSHRMFILNYFAETEHRSKGKGKEALYCMMRYGKGIFITKQLD